MTTTVPYIQVKFSLDDYVETRFKFNGWYVHDVPSKLYTHIKQHVPFYLLLHDSVKLVYLMYNKRRRRKALYCQQISNLTVYLYIEDSYGVYALGLVSEET